jgi:hypothetical protein
VGAAETGTGGTRPGRRSRRRVVLLAESAGLAAVLIQLLGPADRLSRLGSLRELADSRSLDTADVVVLDLDAPDRIAAVGQVRRRYRGPLVVVVARGEGPGPLRPDAGCTLLARPFSAAELAAALAIPARPPADPAPAPDDLDPLAGPDPAAFDPKAAARRAPWRPPPAVPSGRLSLLDRAQRLLVTLTRSWQARRRVRVAGFSAFALVAFTVAFALAAQGRCGPGCDAFGTGFSPAPTIAPASSHAPSTTGPKRPTTTTVIMAGTVAGGDGDGFAGGRAAAPTTAGQATTTSGRPSGGAATTRPATTRPPTTTAPTTTAPTTTAAPTTTTTVPPAQLPGR